MAELSFDDLIPPSAPPAPLSFDDLVPQTPAQQAIAAAHAAGLSRPPTPQSVAEAARGPAPAERTWGQAAAGVAAQTMRGARRGVANITGLPVDIVNAVMGYAGAPVSPEPFMGSRSIDRMLGAPAQGAAAVLNAAGVPASAEIAPPANAAERIMGRVGEEIGAAAIPGAAALRAAGAGAQAARQGGALSQMFVEPAAVALETGRAGRYVGREAATAASAGLGAGLVNEATGAATTANRSAGQNLGDFLGAMGGVGLQGVAQGVGGGLRNVVSALTGNPRYADEVVRNDVVDALLRAAGTPEVSRGVVDSAPLVEAIMNGKRVGNAIPGYRETLGDRTGIPGIQAAEYNQAGARPGAYLQRSQDNAQAVEAAIQPLQPQTSPGALRSELQLERSRVLTEAEVQRLNAQNAFDDAAQSVRPVMTGEGRGADIRGALADAQTAARAQVDEAWRPINDSTAQVDIRPLAEQFAGIRAETPLAAQPSLPAASAVPERLSSAADPTAPAMVPLREVTATRSALTDEARAAAATPGQNEAARLASQFIGATDQFIDQAVPPALGDQLRQARAARRDLANRFERPGDAPADVLRTRQGGDFQMPDSSVARRFVQSDQGRIADFRALMREAGDDARVVPAVRDQILEDVRSRGLLDNPRQLEAYLGQYQTILSDQRFSGVRQELTTVAGLRRALDDAAGAETRLQRQVGTDERPGTGPVGQYLRFGDERAADAMRTVLGSREPARAMDDILRFVNDDPKAVDGARRAFWDIMEHRSRRAGEATRQGDAQPWMPERLHRFLNDPANAAVAERLWRDNPEHLARIRELADVLRQTDTRARGRAPGTSGTGQIMNESILPSAETLGSLALAERRGQVGLPFIAIRLGSVMARRATSNQQREAFQRALDRALTDPDWAAALLKENNPANRAALGRMAKSWMGNEVSTLVDMLGPDNETNDAIMRAR